MIEPGEPNGVSRSPANQARIACGCIPAHRTGKALWCWFTTRPTGPNCQQRLTAFKMQEKASSIEPGGPSGAGFLPGYQARTVSGDSLPSKCRRKPAVSNRVGPAVRVSYQTTRPELSAVTRRLQKSGQSQQHRTGWALWCWSTTRPPGSNCQRRLAAFKSQDKASSAEPGGPYGVGLPPDHQARTVSGDSPH